MMYKRLRIRRLLILLVASFLLVYFIGAAYALSSRPLEIGINVNFLEFDEDLFFDTQPLPPLTPGALELGDPDDDEPEYPDDDLEEPIDAEPENPDEDEQELP